MIAAYRHYGEEVPDGLIPPELCDIEHDYWRAFLALASERQDGGPIPWTAVKAYFQHEGFGQFQTFIRIITMMDNVYLKARERESRETKK